MFESTIGHLNNLAERSHASNQWHTLTMLTTIEEFSETYLASCDFIGRMISEVQATQMLLFNKFISQELTWLAKLRPTIKHAGVFEPFAKFPAFLLCIEVAEMVGREDGALGEGQAALTVTQKVVASLFSWLKTVSKTDEKYTNVSIVENCHYFYTVFSHTNNEALEQYVDRTEKMYKRHLKLYVRWSLQYEMPDLTVFWAKLFELMKKHNDPKVIPTFLTSAKLREVVKDYLRSGHKVQKMIDNLWVRLQKHLPHNVSLQGTVWRRITDFFLTHFKRFLAMAALCYPGEKIPVSFEEMEQRFKRGRAPAAPGSFQDSDTGSVSLSMSTSFISPRR